VDGSRAYVTNTGADSVSVIDTTRNQVIKTLPVGGFPEGIAYHAKNNHVYIVSWMDNVVDVLDAKTNTIIDHIPVGEKARAFGQFIGNVF